MKLSDSKNKLTCFVIMTLFPFYKNMLQFSGWSCSYKNGALLAKFQPGVLNPFVLICGCLLYSSLARASGLLIWLQNCHFWIQCSRFVTTWKSGQVGCQHKKILSKEFTWKSKFPVLASALDNSVPVTSVHMKLFTSIRMVMK